MMRADTPTKGIKTMNISDIETRLALLETCTRAKSADHARIRRQLRAVWVVGVAGTVVTVVFGANKVAGAQGYGITLAQVATRIAALETKTASMTAITDPATGKPTVRFTGVNVQIVSGAGSTGATVNGAGNLLIGYIETGRAAVVSSDTDVRTGSHNVVIGTLHNYSSFGGLASGNFNTVGNYAAAFAHGNTTSAVYSTVTGGENGFSSGYATSVSGGANHRIFGFCGSISGGTNSFISGNFASISGGGKNRAYSTGTVSGGLNNVASGDSDQYGTVSGGRYNTASGFASSVSGGSENDAYASYASVSGGISNGVGDRYGSISGGAYSDLNAQRVIGAQSISGGFQAELAPTNTPFGGPGTQVPYRWRAGRLYSNF